MIPPVGHDNTSIMTNGVMSRERADRVSIPERVG